MKVKILSILSVAVLVGALAVGTISTTGCKTITNYVNNVSTNAQQLAQLGQDVKSAVQTGTEIALQKDASSRVYFIAADATLAQLLNTTNVIDPNTLANALEQLPVAQLQSPEAQIALTTIVGVYDMYYQSNVSSTVSSNVIANTLLINLRAGIEAGITSVPAPAAPKNFKLASPESFGVHLNKPTK